ncbi:hypothetical protein F4778DRAFT_786205 [Xylariomycetidae sp. FL2044]|nr:hypothetical protein F4778DRAFT_786205 [Xylariomycetidae sp. FL2044]
MTSSIQPVGQGPPQCSLTQGPTVGRLPLGPGCTAALSLKRPMDDDDDIEFISSKPVKKRKVSGQDSSNKNNAISHPPPLQPTPTAPTPMPTFPIPIAHESKDMERRISTGMVGLPSDLSAMEISYALRGVSLPVLENFGFHQPFRKPRSPSPPELSPKQLPPTISPAMLDISVEPGGSRTEPLNSSVSDPCSAGCAAEIGLGQFSSHLSEGRSVIDKPAVVTTPVQTPKSPCPAPLKQSMQPCLKERQAQRESSPAPEPAVDHSPATHDNSFHHASQPHASKRPCEICRLQQQANVARAQGLPLMNPAMPHHMMPQMPYHPPYGQRLHPQMMPLAPGNMHPYGHPFAPYMMPPNGNTFGPMHPSSMPPPPLPLAQQMLQHQQDAGGSPTQPRQPGTKPTQADSKPQPSGTPTTPAATSSKTTGPPTPTATPSPSTSPSKPAPNSAPKTTTTPRSFPAAAAPQQPSTPVVVRPPASLIQPTYRKPSPNLIVDVAETCQERFPFEEVAKRHNTTLDKVFNVFAAIIQVPLLRCPTDRRRPGRLGTARVKEYAKAKKDMQQQQLETSRGGGAGGGKGVGGVEKEKEKEREKGKEREKERETIVVTPLDIANRLGVVDFPEGFGFEGQP